MSFLSGLFVDVKLLPNGIFGFIQLVYLLTTYGYVLSKASSMISAGSELLLLVPSVAGIVGSVVLPILGTLPDSLIILFSGMGPDAQEQLDVGVGALAGSTIMLLTIPWFISIYAGRVDYNAESGQLNYRGDPKLNHSVPTLSTLSHSGVVVGPSVRNGAVILMVTSFTYLLLQVPGVVYSSDGIKKLTSIENSYALIGIIVCALLFTAYLVYQIRTASSHLEGSQQDRRDKVIAEAIQRGEISLLGALKSEMGAVVAHHANEGTPLILEQEDEMMHRLKVVLWPFFHKYDESRTGTLDIVELASAFRDLGETIVYEDVKLLFDEFDTDESGCVDFHEFVVGTAEYIRRNGSIVLEEGTDQQGKQQTAWGTEQRGEAFRRKRISSMLIEEGQIPAHLKALETSHDQNLRKRRETGLKKQQSKAFDATSALGITTGSPGVSGKVAGDIFSLGAVAEQCTLPYTRGGEQEEEEEEEEMPDDLSHLSPAEQQVRIKKRAFFLLMGGTLLLLLFTDPMVDAMGELGNRTGLGAFYVSFVLAPFVANAPELVAAYHHSSKKTSSSIAISLATLQGSVCMNNTFALGMFMIVIYSKQLVWQYLAETLAILLVEIASGLISLKKVHTLGDAYLLVVMYPLSLLLVMGLQHIGWD